MWTRKTCGSFGSPGSTWSPSSLTGRDSMWSKTSWSYILEKMSARSEIATHSMDGNIDVGMTLMLTLENCSTGSDLIFWFSSHLKERPRHSNVKMLSFACVQLIWGAQTAMWWCVAPLYSTHNIITKTAKKYDPQFCHLCVPPLYSTYNIKVY